MTEIEENGVVLKMTCGPYTLAMVKDSEHCFLFHEENPVKVFGIKVENISDVMNLLEEALWHSNT